MNLSQSIQVGRAGIKQSPTCYVGDATGARAERDRAMVAYQAEIVADAIRAIKADEESPRLHKEFFDRVRISVGRCVRAGPGNPPYSR